MAAPIGAIVKIYYDSHVPVGPGDAIQTPTGRTYVVMDRRIQKRGKHAGRQHLVCVVAKEPSPGMRILPIYWYKRG